MTGIAPWLAVADAADALAFYAAAFGAVELERHEDGAGNVVVAHLSIDGADFWVQQDGEADPRPLDRLPVRMILAVGDPDAVFARAVAAGATQLYPVSDAHGWRIGRIVDPSGHHWEIGRPLGEAGRRPS